MIAALVLAVAVVAVIRYLRGRATQDVAEPVTEEQPAPVVEPAEAAEPDAEPDAEPVAEAVSG